MDRRHSRRKKPIRRNKIKKASNIQVFKLVDPIGQSALFIFFVYTLDADSGISYFLPLLMLIAWQISSAIVNLFFTSDAQLRYERKFYMIAVGIFTVILVLFNRLFLKRLLTAAPTQGFEMRDILAIAIGLSLSFWYFFICFREIRSMMKGVTDDD